MPKTLLTLLLILLSPNIHALHSNLELECEIQRVFNHFKSQKFKHLPGLRDRLFLKKINNRTSSFSIGYQNKNIQNVQIKSKQNTYLEEISMPLENYKVRIDLKNDSSNRMGYLWQDTSTKKIKLAKIYCI